MFPCSSFSCLLHDVFLEIPSCFIPAYFLSSSEFFSILDASLIAIQSPSRPRLISEHTARQQQSRRTGKNKKGSMGSLQTRYCDHLHAACSRHVVLRSFVQRVKAWRCRTAEQATATQAFCLIEAAEQCHHARSGRPSELIVGLDDDPLPPALPTRNSPLLSIPTLVPLCRCPVADRILFSPQTRMSERLSTRHPDGWRRWPLQGL